jgi:hypothetical protein
LRSLPVFFQPAAPPASIQFRPCVSNDEYAQRIRIKVAAQKQNRHLMFEELWQDPMTALRYE